MRRRRRARLRRGPVPRRARPPLRRRHARSPLGPDTLAEPGRNARRVRRVRHARSARPRAACRGRGRARPRGPGRDRPHQPGLRRASLRGADPHLAAGARGPRPHTCLGAARLRGRPHARVRAGLRGESWRRARGPTRRGARSGRVPPDGGAHDLGRPDATLRAGAPRDLRRHTLAAPRLGGRATAHGRLALPKRRCADDPRRGRPPGTARARRPRPAYGRDRRRDGRGAQAGRVLGEHQGAARLLLCGLRRPRTHVGARGPPPGAPRVDPGQRPRRARSLRAAWPASGRAGAAQ